VQQVRVIEQPADSIDWDKVETFEFQIQEVEEKPDVEDDLAKSTWEIVESDEPVVDLNKFNFDETILYNGETRQRLTNDLEELEYFLKGRLHEMQSPDQALFDIYKSVPLSEESPEKILQFLTVIGQIQKLLNGPIT
jgi:hypothetical protein